MSEGNEELLHGVLSVSDTGRVSSQEKGGGAIMIFVKDAVT